MYDLKNRHCQRPDSRDRGQSTHEWSQDGVRANSVAAKNLVTQTLSNRLQTIKNAYNFLYCQLDK